MNIKEAIEHCWDRKDYPEVFRDDAGLDISIPGFITRGSWIRNNSPRTVTLDVTTYRGVSWNAVHYYGNIIIDGKETKVYRGLPLDDSEYIKNQDEVRLCSGGAADDYGFGKEDDTFVFEG